MQRMRPANTHLQSPDMKSNGVNLKYVDTIVHNARITMHQCNSYPKHFKAKAVQECLQPDVSVRAETPI
ncbi:hypothetical protein Q058_00125 [Pseudomonas aeruginosa BL04]|nr:hypothetical protein Q058_00125 [Pseudomonas aeruginosa BL04]